jgi:S-adenosylhomocysteine hydrolase
MANVPRVLHFWRERDGRASRRDPRYSADAFRRCKIHFLRHGRLSGHASVGIWGAGRVGKAFARTLAEEGVRVRHFFDIDPRKIGQRIDGARVRDARDAGEPGGAYLLVAVGSNGARELIRAELAVLGMREPRDYRCVA